AGLFDGDVLVHACDWFAILFDLDRVAVQNADGNLLAVKFNRAVSWRDPSFESGLLRLVVDHDLDVGFLQRFDCDRIWPLRFLGSFLSSLRGGLRYLRFLSSLGFRLVLRFHWFSATDFRTIFCGHDRVRESWRSCCHLICKSRHKCLWYRNRRRGGGGRGARRSLCDRCGRRRRRGGRHNQNVLLWWNLGLGSRSRGLLRRLSWLRSRRLWNANHL